MNPVVLHIGSAKTGTSSLQQYLTEYAASLAGVQICYPLAGRRGGGQVAHHNLCYEKQYGRVESGAFNASRGVWNEALAEIDQHPGATGVISSEAFMNAPNLVPIFRKVLQGRSVDIVAYVRRQDLWLQSAWNQQARFGRCSLDFSNFCRDVRERGRGAYDQQLQPWADVFGEEHLVIRNFDSLEATGIIPDFFERMLPNIKIDPLTFKVERKNTKAGIRQLVAVDFVLRSCREVLGEDFQLAASTAVKIANFFRDRPGEVTNFSTISYDMACDIFESYENSNTRLAELSPDFRSSGGFLHPTASEYSNVVDLTEYDASIFDTEERRFLEAITRSVSRDLTRGELPTDSIVQRSKRRLKPRLIGRLASLNRKMSSR